MTTFIPFQQSSLFSNIVGGGGQPLGAVPMNFADPVPYNFTTDPMVPDNDVPESDFDMDAFCSVPANANHPMCVNPNAKDSNDPKPVKIEGTDRTTTDDNFIPTDEEIANMTNEEYLANLRQRGWLKNSMLGVLDSKGPMVTLRDGQISNPYFTLAFGELQKAKREKMIKELTDRGIITGVSGNPIFDTSGIQFDITGSGDTDLSNVDKTKQGLLYIDDGVKKYGKTKGTEPTTFTASTSDFMNTDEKRKIYEKVVKKKREGKINLGQMVNEYRQKTGYFSPATTRDRESSYAETQGKKGTYSYRARGR